MFQIVARKYSFKEKPLPSIYGSKVPIIKLFLSPVFRFLCLRPHFACFLAIEVLVLIFIQALFIFVERHFTLLWTN